MIEIDEEELDRGEAHECLLCPRNCDCGGDEEDCLGCNECLDLDYSEPDDFDDDE